MSVPEYLKPTLPETFTAEMRAWRRVVLALLAALFVMLGAVLALLVAWHGPRAAAGSAHSWTAQQQRALATKLRTEGLQDEAVAAFEKYLDTFDPAPDERASIYYTLGKTRVEQGRFAEALACFYRVEIADPRSALVKEAGAEIVTCLERLGRGVDAKYALDRQTALHPEAVQQPGRGAVVATIGKDEISVGDVNDELQQLPAQMQKQFERVERKSEFLRQMIAQRLLADKARMLGYDRDAALRRQVAAFERELLVQRVMQTEIAKRVKIDPSDVATYFQANKERYLQPEGARVACVVFTNAAAAQKELRRIGTNTSAFAAWHQAVATTQSAGMRAAQGWATDDGLVAGIGQEPQLAAAALAARQGLITNPVALAQGWAVACVTEYTPRAERAFSEVQREVEAAYREEKEQRAVSSMIEEAVTSERVKIFAERLSAGPVGTNTTAAAAATK